MKTKNTKTVKKSAAKPVKSAPKKAAPKKIKVAAPAKTKKINVNGAITAVDEEFNNLINQVIENKNTKDNKQNVTFAPVAAPRRKEKFVDPAILFKLEAARGILRKPNGDNDYSLPTIKQFNQAVKDGRLTGQPIADKQ